MADTTLVDFVSGTLPPAIRPTDRVSRDGLIISRLALPPNPGEWMGSPQFTLVMHEGAPFEFNWRPPDRQRPESFIVQDGQFHLTPADHPNHVSWEGAQSVLVVAMTAEFIDRMVGEAFDGRIPEIRARAALDDPAIGDLAACLRRDMKANGRCSGLCLDFVGASLALKLFETYGESIISPVSLRGGLGASRQRRVIDYIEAHLGEDIRLAELAAETGLSPHHFGKAFKASLGKPPCQYVAERRINKAKEMLLADHMSITEIALSLGYSSHSHFCDVFRRVTGTTPSQFRKDRCRLPSF